MFDITGRSALVTGASGGLGLHFAQLLAGHGARVTLAARRRELLEEARAGIERDGGRADVVEMDVTDESSVEQAVAAVDGGVDILVNNAGLSRNGPVIDMEGRDWDLVLDTNLKGAFLAARAVARRSRDEGRGASIVNVASILGLRVGNAVAAYAASKAGLVQLTKSMALEWARFGIRVNALCPGYVETDLNREFFATKAGADLIRRIPQRRLGQPHDLDGPMLLLCSDAGVYMTGSVLAVDGGHLVSSL